MGAALIELERDGLAKSGYRCVHVPSRPALREWVDAQAELVELS